MDIRNRLRKIRRERGLSAAALATKVGVRRQTIYAIEAQRYVPNTLVALRLAQSLEVSVEDLFAVASDASLPASTAAAEPLSGACAAAQPDLPVHLCKVGNRMICVPSSPVLGELPAADAVVVGPGKRGRIIVRPFRAEKQEGNRLLVAGCDPAMPVLARYLARHGNIELLSAGCSSLQALTWLKEGRIHIAGTHLQNEANDQSNTAVVRKFFPKGRCRIATFAAWEEGLVAAAGNPRGVSAVKDLAGSDLRLINREVGSGSRFLLDHLLKSENIPAAMINGYQQTANGHILAAWHVYSGKADCCIATRAAARVFGLHFIPLAHERYDLVIPERYWDMPAVQIMLDALNRSSLKSELEALGGYDTTQTGRIVV